MGSIGKNRAHHDLSPFSQGQQDRRRRPVAAIVLAAGLGTRMNSARAKVLHYLGGRPLIVYPLAALRASGADPIVVVVGHQAQAVQEACAPYGVRFAVQAEQKGTGHAALAARPALPERDGDVVIVYGDLPFIRAASFQRLIERHQATAASVSLLTASIADPTGFGRIVRDDRGHVARIVEDRDCTAEQRAIHEINVGAYCADTSFLFRALQRLRPANAQAELYLTDIIELARADGARIADAAAEARESAQISSRADLAEREKTLRDDINGHWMEAGVTLEDPSSTHIGPDVVIGRDTVIGPNVILRGATHIGENCQLDGTALITDSTLGKRVHVKFGVVMTEAMLEDDVQVGPFAQLRPGTRLGAGVHIGDFVETKNAVLGAGTKANHHAYLGDAEIGRDANIGAGTITCNYDGFRKARTVIGDRVQVGSDTQLVAPVSVGDDAYIATGTTVRKDVPPGVLVFNPRPQLQRAGWVAARRTREQTVRQLPPGDVTEAAPSRERVKQVPKARVDKKDMKRPRPAQGRQRAVARKRRSKHV